MTIKLNASLFQKKQNNNKYIKLIKLKKYKNKLQMKVIRVKKQLKNTDHIHRKLIITVDLIIRRM